MARLRARGRILEAVALRMLEEGKGPLTRRDWSNCRTVPLKSSMISNYFGSWSRMLGLMKRQYPALWAELEQQKDVKIPIPESKLIFVDPPEVSFESEKPSDPLERLSAGLFGEAQAASAETESDNEESI